MSIYVQNIDSKIKHSAYDKLACKVKLAWQLM